MKGAGVEFISGRSLFKNSGNTSILITAYNYSKVLHLWWKLCIVLFFNSSHILEKFQVKLQCL